MTLRHRSYLTEANGEAVVNGKKGMWRRVANHNVFFPDDGSDPIGLPKPKNKKQKAKEVKKAKKKVAFFNKLFKGLKKNGKQR